MSSNPDIFASIRVSKTSKRGAKDTAVPESEAVTCQYKNCTKPGPHKAPKGRGREGEFYNFCVDHVREYNRRYNYFSGMSEEEFLDYQKDEPTGHRPTWNVGSNRNYKTETPSAKRTRRALGGFDPSATLDDPHSLAGSAPGGRANAGSPSRRALGTIERRCFKQMHLPETATAEEIKTQYKELVKRHHPDANGGDRGSEDKLREVIQAYNYLKQAGLC